MNDSHVTSFYLANEHWMNLVYAVVAMCVISKMAVLSVLAARAPRIIRIVMKAAALGFGTIIAMKALGRFDGDDPAQWLDIIRETSLCALLFTIAFYLDQLTKKTTS